jgi:hypothetical protein
VKRFSFASTVCLPASIPTEPLKITLVGGDRAYEFNINLD